MNKYYPSKTKELVGNIPILKQIITQLKNPPATLLINGPSGCGKSTYLNIILRDLKFEIHYYQSPLHSFISFLKQNTNTKKVLIINNIYNILSKVDKEFLKGFIKTNKFFHIIIFHNLDHNKYLISLKKYLIEFKLNYISDTEFISYLTRVCNAEKIQLMPNVSSSLLNLCQNNIYKLLSVLSDINKPIITLNDISIYNNLMHNKHIISNIYEYTSTILSKKLNIDEIISLTDNNKMFLPLMIHENYPNYIFKTYNNLSDYILTISNKLVKSDIIENYIYNDYSWFLQFSYDFFSCSYISRYINQNNNNNHFNYVKTQYCNELTQYSIKIQNKKYLTHSINLLNKRDTDIHYINHILVNKKTTNKVQKFIKEYNLQQKDIECLIKINKLLDNTEIKKLIKQ